MKANAPNIDELIEAAADRDTVALSRLYGQAAAWIKAGQGTARTAGRLDCRPHARLGRISASTQWPQADPGRRRACADDPQ